MNLTSFMNKVFQKTNSMSKGQMLSFITRYARTLPEEERDKYIQYLTKEEDVRDVKANDAADHVLMAQKDIKSEADKTMQELERVQSGELEIFAYFDEEYDSWDYEYDRDEYTYSDPEGVLQTVSVAINLVHRCIDCENYIIAMELSEKVLELNVKVGGDYCEYESDSMSFRELVDAGLVNREMSDFMIDALYSVYFVKKGNARLTGMFELFETASPISDIMLEKVMQAGGNELLDFSEFLSDWIPFLGEKSGRLPDTLLSEAVSLLDDFEREADAAAKLAKTHPHLYQDVLERYAAYIEDKVLLRHAQKALTTIPPDKVVRGDIALLAAGYALRLEKNKLAEECWVEALRSDTTPVNLLRLMNESNNYVDYRDDAISVCESVQTDRYYSYYSRQLGDENRVSEITYYSLAFFTGQFEKVLKKGLNNKQNLGWSGSFMKPGIALFLLCLYNGGMNELPVGCDAMRERVVRELQFSTEEYQKGLVREMAENDGVLFSECFQKWKDTEGMKRDTQKKVLKKISTLISDRTAAILGGKYRNHYYDCAAYVAAYGEVLESRGESGAKRKTLDDYHQAYIRYNAFTGELRKFGLMTGKRR